jgi:hypothetical protein
MGFRKKNSKRLKGKWGLKGRQSHQSIPGSSADEPGSSGDPGHHHLHLHGDGDDLCPELSSEAGRHAGLPVVRAQADAQGVVTLEVRHNTMVIMEAGVQEWWEHRIFKPSIAQLSSQTPNADTASGQEQGGEEGPGDGAHARASGEGVGGREEESGAQAETLVEPRINLTFHVHVSS